MSSNIHIRIHDDTAAYLAGLARMNGTSPHAEAARILNREAEAPAAAGRSATANAVKCTMTGGRVVERIGLCECCSTLTCAFHAVDDEARKLGMFPAANQVDSSAPSWPAAPAANQVREEVPHVD